MTMPAQREHGLFAALSRAHVYDAVQDLLGANDLRARVARDFALASRRPGGARTRVLDVGCGTARLVEHLGDCEYLGVDENPGYVAAARERYGDRARFTCADAGDDVALGPEGGFDLALMFGLLHHLDDDAARRLLAAVARRLAPGGRLVTLDGALDARTRRAARLLLSWDRGLHVRRPEEYRRLAEHDFGRVIVHVRHDLLRVPYTHAILECFVAARGAA